MNIEFYTKLKEIQPYILYCNISINLEYHSWELRIETSRLEHGFKCPHLTEMSFYHPNSWAFTCQGNMDTIDTVYLFLGDVLGKGDIPNG